MRGDDDAAAPESRYAHRTVIRARDRERESEGEREGERGSNIRES